MDSKEEPIKEKEVLIAVTDGGNHTLRSFFCMLWKGNFLMETDQEQEKSWITEASIIALLTFVGYLLSLSYESGFCKYFNIPHNLISLNPTMVLATVLNKSSLLITIVLYVGFANLASRRMGSLCAKGGKSLAISYIVIAVCLYMLNPLMNLEFRENVMLFAILTSILGLVMMMIIIVRSLVGSWWTKHITDISNGVIFVVLLVCVGIGINWFRERGTSEAKSMDEFAVIAGSPDVVVLRSYGEYLFAAPINRETKEFEKKLVILKMSEPVDHKPLTLSVEKMGPLRVKP